MIIRNMFKRLIENKDKAKVLKSIMKGIEEESKYNDKVEKAIENEIINKANQKEKKTYEECNILNVNSELKINSNNKYEIETKLIFYQHLDKKIKRALLKSIIEELNKNFSDYEFNFSLKK